MRVAIHYSDGNYTWSEAPDGDEDNTIEVPIAVVQLWRAAAELDRVVTAQLQALDNVICTRREREEDDASTE